MLYLEAITSKIGTMTLIFEATKDHHLISSKKMSFRNYQNTKNVLHQKEILVQ